MAQEVFQRRVIGIGQLVDPFVEPDVPQAVILDFWPDYETVSIHPMTCRRSAYWQRLESLGVDASSAVALVALLARASRHLLCC